MLIYDIEIKKAIPSKNGEVLKDIEYCDGWSDYENMGISCICCYDYEESRYRVFLEDNISEFQDLVWLHDIVVGFNNISFDNKVLRASKALEVIESTFKVNIDDKSYDLLREIWTSAGIGPVFKYPSHTGYSLNAIMESNFGDGKVKYGETSPVYYQQRKYGNLIDYCLTDVWMTKKLLDRVMYSGKITSPRNGSTLEIRKPYKKEGKEND
jgi:hypothetical protein